MKGGSEILSIIEAAMEGNKKKAIAYAELLIDKLPDEEQNLKTAIKSRLDGSYKKPIDLDKLSTVGDLLNEIRTEWATDLADKIDQDILNQLLRKNDILR